jgi:D-2-hydroxyacid dehydrogenase (NADP+)
MGPPENKIKNQKSKIKNRPSRNRTAIRSKIPLAVWLTDPVVDCWTLNDRQLRRLKRELPSARITACRSAAAFRKALPEARAAVVWVFDPAWLELAPRLEWLATPAAGRDYFQADRPGLDRTYGAFHGRIMGETVAAMVLAVNRGLLANQRAQADGNLWPRDALSGSMRTLGGTHAVIVGFGHIGAWIGRCLKPFGVRITGVRRHPRAAPRPDYFDRHDRIAPLPRLDALLPAADHLILALPAAPETDGLINAARLSRLPPTAAVYNVGRGNVLDEAALARALTAKRIRAACLDVFRQEPLPASSPLRAAPNTLLFPHASAIAPEYLDLYLDEFIPRFRARYR